MRKSARASRARDRPGLAGGEPPDGELAAHRRRPGLGAAKPDPLGKPVGAVGLAARGDHHERAVRGQAVRGDHRPRPAPGGARGRSAGVRAARGRSGRSGRAAPPSASSTRATTGSAGEDRAFEPEERKARERLDRVSAEVIVESNLHAGGHRRGASERRPSRLALQAPCRGRTRAGAGRGACRRRSRGQSPSRARIDLSRAKELNNLTKNLSTKSERRGPRGRPRGAIPRARTQSTASERTTPRE